MEPTKTFCATALLAVAGVAFSGTANAVDTNYEATIDVRAALPGQDLKRVAGIVFEDLNRDGRFQPGEPGIEGVMVSNGREVVVTDELGQYRIPPQFYRDDMNIFVSKPDCYDVPVDQDNVPQFAYIHKRHGSDGDLRFGGLEATGVLPRFINFPMIHTGCMADTKFKVAVSGDTQPYSNIEVGYVRDTLAQELAERDDIEFLIVEGDIMGDDLGLMPRYKQIMSAADTGVYLVIGNHDVDFDAVTDADSSDTFRREWGPHYYSFTIGKVHFVVFDNVYYPCEAVDLDGNPDPRWSFCEPNPTYNGRISEDQLIWFENNLRHVPEDHLIVLNYHIPTVSFIDQYAIKHSEDTAFRLYEILGYDLVTGKAGRPALALSGHTHTLEQFRPGEYYEGWFQATHPAPVPFPQIVTGAACGSWWSGDFNDAVIPESYQRLGAPRGYLLFEFDGNTYTETFKATGKAAEEQMSVSFLTPDFRAWYDALYAWLTSGAAGTPPFNVNDLGDVKILKLADVQSGLVELVANIWNGSKDSEVRVQFDDRPPLVATRTQMGEGEGELETLDPYALRRQMNVARFALRSTNFDENPYDAGTMGDRSDGFELFNASTGGPADPQPLGEFFLTNQSNHVWTVTVPGDLAEGVHKVKVTTLDVHGQQFQSTMVFEVREPLANVPENNDPQVNDPTDQKYYRRVETGL